MGRAPPKAVSLSQTRHHGRTIKVLLASELVTGTTPDTLGKLAPRGTNGQNWKPRERNQNGKRF